MKTVVYVLIALLAGMVLGSLPIKGDLRNARSEIADLKKKLSSRTTGQGGLASITSMLQISEKTAPASHGSADGFGRRRHHAADTATGPDAAVAHASSNAAPVSGFHHDPDATNLNQALETASALWKTRADLARDSFVSNVATSIDQAATFDVVMTAMNLRLSNSIRTWVDFVKQEEDVTPETGVRIMNDLSSSLVLTYNDLDGAMPEGWRTNAGPKFQVFDFINPDVARPLTEIESLFKSKDRGPDTSGAGDDDSSPEQSGVSVERIQ